MSLEPAAQMNTDGHEANRLTGSNPARQFLLRLLNLLLLATCIGWVLHRTGQAVTTRGGTAGFGVGIVQGALMPLAMPNLLIGDDVNIYSSNNTGRTYKLGYSAGVNLCGLVFFGFFSWRIRRWRRQDVKG